MCKCSSRPQAARNLPSDEDSFSSSSSSIDADPSLSLSLITKCDRGLMIWALCVDWLLEATEMVSGCSSLNAAVTDRLK